MLTHGQPAIISLLPKEPPQANFARQCWIDYPSRNHSNQLYYDCAGKFSFNEPALSEPLLTGRHVIRRKTAGVFKHEVFSGRFPLSSLRDKLIVGSLFLTLNRFENTVSLNFLTRSRRGRQCCILFDQ
jgi:hypothetical protein